MGASWARRGALLACLLAFLCVSTGCCSHCEDDTELPDFAREARCRRRCERERERARESHRECRDEGFFGSFD
jgi:hypothetical protein